MKIVSYVLLGLLAVVACLGAYYASGQKTTMEVLVGARRGLTEEVSGMEAANRDLETSAAATANKRAKELKDAKEQLAVTQEAVNKLEDAKREEDKCKAALEAVEEKLKEAEARAAEIAKLEEEFEAQLRAVPGLEDADRGNAAETMDTKLEEYGNELTSLRDEKKKLTEQREQLNQEVSICEVEFQKKKAENDSFMEVYRKNGVEYSIAAVDPRWHFVIFNVGEDSGLIPGDTTPLLARRDCKFVTELRIVRVSGGQVVAEYDEKGLPCGVMPEIGDQVLRKIPAGS